MVLILSLLVFLSYYFFLVTAVFHKVQTSKYRYKNSIIGIFGVRFSLI